MSTRTRRGADSGEQPPAASGDGAPRLGHAGADGADGHPKRSAWGRFTGSWGIALRMARRDVRRHKGRSALIMIMVALPTALLVLALVAAATSQVTGAEQIPSRMGNGVASVDYPQLGQAIEQPPDPGVGGSSSTNGGTSIPGWDEGGSSFANAAVMSTLTGTKAVPFLEESVTTRRNDRRLTLASLALDGRQGVTGKVTLTSGHLPERAGEVLVTTAGANRGLPTSGTLEVHANSEDLTVKVVGTAEAVRGGGGEYLDLVTSQPMISNVSGGSWILLDDKPLTWSKVMDLNRYGLTVVSADVLRNPPALSEIPPQIQDLARFESDRTGTYVAIGGALLLVITTLLVGPAFAVSAARQRRTLALSASNGATTAQLRHSVLAQAVVLGVIAAGVGAALGIGAAWLLTHRVWFTGKIALSGPFELPVLPVVATTVTAMASAVIAALIPARRLGRLDIIGVMKGQSVSPRPSKVVFLIGATLAGIGGVALISFAASQAATGRDGGEVGTALATISLVVGAVMLSPMILVGIARLSSRLPVSLRMATRDAGRQRSRSVPSVAAILAGVAALTMVLIASGSDEEQRRLEYAPTNLSGDTNVFLNGESPDAETIKRLSDGFRSVRTGLVVSPVSSIDSGDPMLNSMSPNPPSKPYDTRAINVVPPGCTPEKTVYDPNPSDDDSGLVAPCQAIGTHGMGNTGAQMNFTTADELGRRLSAIGRGADVDAVSKGAVVVTRAPGARRIVENGAITVMTGIQRTDPSATDVIDPSSNLRDIKTTTLPAIEVDITRNTSGALFNSSLIATAEVAKAQAWPTRTLQLTLHDPVGPISQDLSDRLGYGASDEIYLTTERGFVSELGPIIAILLGVFMLLLLVITLTSTALTLAEQENDQATLAALGSGRGTRRVMAAAQAFTLCIIGAVLGVAVGIVPGIALAYPLTAQTYDPLTGNAIVGDPILVFPWLILLGFAIAVPVISAGLAAAGIRKAPDATHRTA